MYAHRRTRPAISPPYAAPGGAEPAWRAARRHTGPAADQAGLVGKAGTVPGVLRYAGMSDDVEASLRDAYRSHGADEETMQGLASIIGRLRTEHGEDWPAAFLGTLFHAYQTDPQVRAGAQDVVEPLLETARLSRFVGGDPQVALQYSHNLSEPQARIFDLIQQRNRRG